MRLLLAVLAVGLFVGPAEALLIEVPNPTLHITEIQQGLELADPGDTVLVHAGVYDSVYAFNTPIGRKSAVCRIPDGVTLRGIDRKDAIIDQSNAEYGIVCVDVGLGAKIENLTIRGGVGRDLGRTNDGDGRTLVAAIGCLDGASPTIENVTITRCATGIVVRSDGDPSAPTIEGVLISRGSHHGIYIYENGATPVVIDRTTVVQSFDHGVYVFSGVATIKSSSITHNGKNGVTAYLSDPTIRYSNVYWNDELSANPRNYGGSLDDLTGTDGNVSVEPYYCDYAGASGYDYHVCFASPNIGAGEGGVNIGCYGGACVDCESPVRETSWGAIKALWR
jgi:hypothetical protein